MVIIMQENRSFDSYFGTYPGADGIPGLAGHPGRVPCVPDPLRHRCVHPYHETADRNTGGPHGHGNVNADVNDNKMNGFVPQALLGRRLTCTHYPDAPYCSAGQHPSDVMGYHDRHEIPNYWAYATIRPPGPHVRIGQVVEPPRAPLPRLRLVSDVHRQGRSDELPARRPEGPACCPTHPASTTAPCPDYPWTDITWLLHAYNVSWAYYVRQGTQPDCSDDAMFCAPVPQDATTPGIWNPLPYFDTVRRDRQVTNIQPADRLLQAAEDGTLPSVSWITPTQAVQRPPASR